MSREDIAEVFERAAVAIEKHGWIKGKLGSPSQGFCIIGAVRFADEGGFGAELFMTKEVSAPKDDLDGFGRSWVEWNDAEARTKEDVTDKLKSLAQLARKWIYLDGRS